jgi:hypothetical protein
MCLQCFSVLDCHFKQEPYGPQFGIDDLHTSGAQKAVVSPPFISVFTRSCSSHWPIVSARSVSPPYPDGGSDFGLFSVTQPCAALLAAVVSSSMMVLTTGSSPGADQFMPLVVRPWLSSFLTSLHIGALDEGFLCSYCGLLVHACSNLTVNHCCPECKVTGASVSPDSLLSAPNGVVCITPRIDLACRLRRSWSSSRLPTSLGSHYSSLPYSATDWMHATWTALTLSGTTLYVLVRVWSLASTALVYFMHQFKCSSNV